MSTDENPYEPGIGGESSLGSLISWWLKVLALLSVLAVGLATLLSARRISPEAARRSSCRNNLKIIALALHNYHDVYEIFPPAYTTDANGKRLHSWRTLLLPFAGGKLLYEKIDLTKPWDDPVNAEARAKPYPIFQCPSAQDLGNRTTYLALVAPGSCFNAAKSCTLKDIVDGPTETLLLIEVDKEHAVPWMAPVDADEALFLKLNENSGLAHPAGFHGVFADAHVTYLHASTPAEVRKALITISGHDEATLPEE